MERMTVTQLLVDRARRFGACVHGVPRVGTVLSDVSFDQLIWAEDTGLLLPTELADAQQEYCRDCSDIVGHIPLCVMACSGGYGCDGGGGYGDGNGGGYGYGGYGYGDGDGGTYGDDGYGDG